MPEELYRTKVGIAYYVLFAIIVVLLAYMIWMCLEFPDDVWVFAILGIVFFLLLLLIKWILFFRIKYVFKENGLSIQGLILHFDIDYVSIKEVTEEASFSEFWFGMYGGTVCSMDQVMIKYDTLEIRKGVKKLSSNNKIYLSPKNKQEFLDKLELKVGAGVVKRGKKKKGAQ